MTTFPCLLCFTAINGPPVGSTSCVNDPAATVESGETAAESATSLSTAPPAHLGGVQSDDNGNLLRSPTASPEARAPESTIFYILIRLQYA